jgi:hypothetical protein
VRVQLSTDALRSYEDAVERAFGADVDYGQIVKFYDSALIGPGRYSTPRVTGAERSVIAGSPDQKHISTSLIERQNLTMRMSMRRFTCLTNGFSKKVENLKAAASLHFAHYNFRAPAPHHSGYACHGGGGIGYGMVAGVIGGADFKMTTLAVLAIAATVSGQSAQSLGVPSTPHMHYEIRISLPNKTLTDVQRLKRACDFANALSVRLGSRVKADGLLLAYLAELRFTTCGAKDSN